MTAPADSWAAYASAILYLAAPRGTLRVSRAPVGRMTGKLPAPARAIYVITAYNPDGAARGAEENAAAQASLEAELTRRQIQWWQAAGGDRGWSHVEASVAVFGVDDEAARALGRSYGQEAIFKIARDGLRVIACHTGRINVSGWVIELLPQGHPEGARPLAGRQLLPFPDRARQGGDAKDAASVLRPDRRAQRVADGLAELETWLRDQVRAGLATAAQAGGDGSGGAEDMAARMVDAQAPGVAGSLRSLSQLPGKGVDWPSRLLSSYAMLHLLIRAHERLDALPDGLAATVRARVGYRLSQKDVLARPAVTDRWLVLGRRDLVDGAVPGRRIWLRGQDTGRHAMVLTFARNGYGSWQDRETATLDPGARLHARLHFYPGEPPMRAIVGERLAAPEPSKPPVQDRDIDAMLADYAAGVEQDPWLTMWPVVLDGTPVPPAPGSGQPWYLVDRAGTALPLAAEQASPWKLLLLSGGQPVTAAGEWHPGGLVLLTAWQKDKAVTL